MSKDETQRGEHDQLVGASKKLVGKVTGSKELEAKGAVQQVAGKIQQVAHNVHKKATEAVDHLASNHKDETDE